MTFSTLSFCHFSPLSEIQKFFSTPNYHPQPPMFQNFRPKLMRNCFCPKFKIMFLIISTISVERPLNRFLNQQLRKTWQKRKAQRTNQSHSTWQILIQQQAHLMAQVLQRQRGPARVVSPIRYIMIFDPPKSFYILNHAHRSLSSPDPQHVRR